MCSLSCSDLCVDHAVTAAVPPFIRCVTVLLVIRLGFCFSVVFSCVTIHGAVMVVVVVTVIVAITCSVVN